MARRTLGTLTLVIGLALTTACALRAPSIADIHAEPSRYEDRGVVVEGTVTTSYGVPLVPYKFYRIDDGTGEISVLSRSSRTPTRGAQVRVRGDVKDVGVIGGRALGLHIEERDLDILRR